MPASNSRDAQLLCPKLPENKPLNEQAGTAPLRHAPADRTGPLLCWSQSQDTDSLWARLLCILLSMLAEPFTLLRTGLALTALGITWKWPDYSAASVLRVRSHDSQRRNKLGPSWSSQNKTWAKGFMKSQLTNPRRSNPGLPSCSLSIV